MVRWICWEVEGVADLWVGYMLAEVEVAVTNVCQIQPAVSEGWSHRSWSGDDDGCNPASKP